MKCEFFLLLISTQIIDAFYASLLLFLFINYFKIIHKPDFLF